MSATVACHIVSAEGEIFSGQVEFLSATGLEGELGISPGHAPLLTALMPGPAEIKMSGGERRIFYISGGYLEVQPHDITILADVALRAGDIDEAAAEQARQQAQRELDQHKKDVDYTRAAAQLAEAMGRLRTLKNLRRHQG